MSEEKKPTETEIIREQVKRARECVESLFAGKSDLRKKEFCWNGLADSLNEIERANEARAKSRKLSLDVTAYDFTEPMVRALLSQGFEVAIAAVVPQLKTVTVSGHMTSWKPPLNPFSGVGSTSDAAAPEPQ